MYITLIWYRVNNPDTVLTIFLNELYKFLTRLGFGLPGIKFLRENSYELINGNLFSPIQTISNAPSGGKILERTYGTVWHTVCVRDKVISTLQNIEKMLSKHNSNFRKPVDSFFSLAWVDTRLLLSKQLSIG